MAQDESTATGSSYVPVPTQYNVLRSAPNQDGTVMLHISGLGQAVAASDSFEDIQSAAKEFILAQTPDELTAEKITLTVN